MKYLLRLYVAGSTARSRRAIESLAEICDRELAGRCEVEVIDVLEHPELADEERVLATPALLRRSPEPAKRIVGDLTDREAVVRALELPASRPRGRAAAPEDA